MEEIKQMLRHIIEQQSLLKGRIVRLEHELMDVEGFDLGWYFSENIYHPLRELNVSENAKAAIVSDIKPKFGVALITDAVRWAFKQGHLPSAERSDYFGEVANELEENYGYAYGEFEEEKCDVDDND